MGDTSHEGFIAQGNVSQQHIKMAFAHVNVIWLNQGAAGVVQLGSHVSQPGEVVEILQGGLTAPPVEVPHKRRAINGRKDCMPSPNKEMVGRITGQLGEIRGSLSHEVHQGIFINPDHFPLNLGPILSKRFQSRRIINNQDARFF